MSTPPDSLSPSMRRNAIANMAGRGASALLWLAATPYALDRLGPERFGVWALFFALSGYMGMLDLGMAGGVSRFVAVAVARRDRDAARRAIVRALALSAALGLVWSVACLVGRGLFLKLFHVPAALAPEVSASLAVFSLSMLAVSIAQVLQWTLMGFQRFDLWNLYFVAGLVANVAVLVGGLALGYGLIATAAAAVVGNAVTVLLATQPVRRCLAGVPVSVEPGPSATWRDMLRFGAMIQATNAFSIGQMQAGKAMLGALGALVWVTHYELAYRVTSTLWALSVLIQGAAYPAAALAHERGGSEPVREVYFWCCRWTFLVAGYVLGLAWLLSPALFRAWLGGSHPEATSTARWLTVAFLMCTLGGPGDAVARGIGAPGLELLRWAVAMVANVALGLWLIPRQGPDGAAIAMGLSFAAGSVVMLFLLHRRIGIGGRAWLIGIAAPRLLPAVLLAGGMQWGLDRWALDSRLEALAALALGGIVFSLAFVASTWRTGDVQAIAARGREWLGRMTARGAGAR